MSDVKYSPAGLVAPITGEPKLIDAETRAAMYEKIQLNQDQIDFLDPVIGKKFMTYFEVGNEKIVMYGNPARMALESELIKSMLSLDPPFQLASNITVMGGALMIIWLHINGVPNSFGKILNLSLRGYFGVRDLINYLDLPLGDATRWNYGVRDQLKKATDEDIKANAEQLANTINDLAGRKIVFKYDDADIMEKLTNVEEVSRRLNHVPIILKRLAQGGRDTVVNEMASDFVGWVEVKKADDSEELVRMLVPQGYTLYHGILTRLGVKLIPTRQGNRIIMYDSRLSELPEFKDEVRSMVDKYRIALPLLHSYSYI